MSWTPFAQLIAAATMVHGCMSVFWAGVLCTTLPRRRSIMWGTVAGALIAVLDILIIGRFLPPIRDLAFLPQLADHLMFGAVVGSVMQWPPYRESIHPDQGPNADWEPTENA